jgi:hypothetical protein
MPRRLIDSKTDLLLAEIAREKQRKGLSKCYEEAMTIKLTELFDYVTGNDDRYLGLNLEAKACELVRNVREYKGQSIDDYLTLPLLDYFFSELKELQAYKLQMLRRPKKKKNEEKISVCS